MGCRWSLRASRCNLDDAEPVLYGLIETNAVELL